MPVTPPETEPVPVWVEDDPEIELSMEMDDEELEFDDLVENEKLSTPRPKNGGPRDYVPLWRLIEMSREDRSLRMELADFADYDDSEKRGGDYAGGLSH